MSLVVTFFNFEGKPRKKSSKRTISDSDGRYPRIKRLEIKINRIKSQKVESKSKRQSPKRIHGTICIWDPFEQLANLFIQ